MIVNPYTDSLPNYLVAHSKLLSPLPPPNNYHSSLTNISTINFPSPFPPFPPLPSHFPSPFTILVLLDMSSAFDTLDHNVRIHRLSAIGITGIALNLFTSYITNRSSSVRINTHSSPSRSITHGVPQGSVLGPLLFNIYLLPMFDIFTDYPDISFHTYTDDLQLYLNCTDSPTYAPDRLSSCIQSIHHWLISNSLKLNPTKTEAIFLHLPQRSSTLPEPPPSHSTIPHSPTLNTSETLASILIPPFPLNIILYTCIHHPLPPTLPPLNPTIHSPPHRYYHCLLLHHPPIRLLQLPTL